MYRQPAIFFLITFLAVYVLLIILSSPKKVHNNNANLVYCNMWADAFHTVRTCVHAFMCHSFVLHLTNISIENY